MRSRTLGPMLPPFSCGRPITSRYVGFPDVKRLGKVRIAQPAMGTVRCAAGHARDVEVSLLVAGATYALGTTDACGYVR
jgi:hypothetical protein